jgi:prenyltransferase beta subunit
MRSVKVVAFTLAIAFVLLAFTAQPVAAANRYDSLRTYMNSRYDAARGGYSIPGDGVTRINPTYGAITIMNEVGTLDNRPPPVPITDVLNFIVTHQWLTGNEDEEPRFGGLSDYLLGPVTQIVNYHGLVTWQLLEAQGDVPGVPDYDINVTASLFWINKTQTAEGGFGVSAEALDEGDGPDLLSTAYALASIRILDTMYQEENAWSWLINETATVEWIESCFDGDAYKMSPDSYLPSVTATAAAVIAYHALDPLSTVPHSSSIQSWLRDRQILDYETPEFIGGFEEGNGTEVPSLTSTYYALTAMDILATVSTTNVTAAQSFLLNCQSEDGAFANAPGFATGSLLYGGYVCEVFGMAEFGGANDVLSSSAFPYSPGATGVEWRTFVIIGIIFVAAVLAVLAVRAD